MTARGTLGKTLTFQGRRGSTAVFPRTVPYDPKSPAQLGIREYTRKGVYYWQGLGAVYQALWNAFVD